MDVLSGNMTKKQVGNLCLLKELSIYSRSYQTVGIYLFKVNNTETLEQV